MFAPVTPAAATAAAAAAAHCTFSDIDTLSAGGILQGATRGRRQKHQPELVSAASMRRCDGMLYCFCFASDY
jgi:hypothetical protein